MDERRFESGLSATSRVLAWLKYVHDTGSIPDPALFNSYPGVIQIGAGVESYYERVSASPEEKAAPADPPIQTEPTMNKEEEAFFQELVGLIAAAPNSDARISVFLDWLTANFADKESAQRALEGGAYLMFENNKLSAADDPQLLGTGLLPLQFFNYMNRFIAHILNTGSYKNSYIYLTNSAGGDQAAYINATLTRDLSAFDAKVQTFDALCIAMVSHDDNVLTEQIGFVNTRAMSLIPLRHVPYIQETTRSAASWSDYLIPPRDHPNPRSQPFYHLTGYGGVCLNRLQFTLLVSEPARIRNLSGIIAYEVSRAPQTADAWRANYGAVAASLSGKPDAEQLFLCELQSALFEGQEQTDRNDWWTRPIATWLTDPSVKWRQNAHWAAGIRALCLTSAKFTAPVAQKLFAKYMSAKYHIPLRLVFLAAPDGSRAERDQDPPLVEPLDPVSLKQYGIPDADYNVAASDLLRAQQAAKYMFPGTPTEIGLPFYPQFVPYYVFPHIHEIDGDVPLPREQQYSRLEAEDAGSVYIPGNYRRNVRNLPVVRGEPSYTKFVKWLSGNFWRLNPATDGTIYCCVVSHPGFMRTLSSTWTGGAIAKNVDFYVNREGALTTGLPPLVREAAPNRRSQLPAALNRIEARAVHDPNAAYTEFRGLVPQFAVNLAPAKQAVNALQPRRHGFFRGQNRNTYRRNLQAGLSRIRQTLRMPRNTERYARIRRQMFGENLDRLMSSRGDSADGVIAKTRKLVGRGGPYENLGPVVTPYLNSMRKPSTRGWFNFRKPSGDLEARARASLTSLREGMHRGGAATRKFRHRK